MDQIAGYLSAAPRKGSEDGILLLAGVVNNLLNQSHAVIVFANNSIEHTLQSEMSAVCSQHQQGATILISTSTPFIIQ